jgi:3-(3-hydroxy-phenyl)propionate hydroxylase
VSATKADVIVVGGGPVGVTTALLLAQRGFAVTVFERAPEVYDLPRAIVMDDEIQRVLQNAGLLDELQAITTPLRGAEFVRPDGERIIGAELPLDAPWPLGLHPTISYYQPELEAFLRAAAIRNGVRLHLGTEVSAIEQHRDGVTVTTGSEVHHADWLVAADGASSRIRKQLGVSFVDQGFDQDWLVLDVRLRREVPTLSPFVQQICDPDRPTTYVIGHDDYRRWEFQLQPDDDRATIADDPSVWRLLEPWLTPDDGELVRAVVYRFHATVADAMRVDRIFLAGDAAHQMPPFLGQGLCSGIRDAANLAWKLQLVADGCASNRLLDTYGAERLPHAAGVVAHAVDTGRLIDELSGRTSAQTGLDAAYGGNRPFPVLRHGMVHGDHPAVGRQLPQPTLDGRPLDELLGTGFGIVIDDATEQGEIVAAIVADGRWDHLARIVMVPVASMPMTLPAGGAVIVRPDRYIAAVCHDVAEFSAASDALLAHLDTALTEGTTA